MSKPFNSGSIDPHKVGGQDAHPTASETPTPQHAKTARAGDPAPALFRADSPGTTLLLIRHAHSTMAGRFCGHSDPPLSEAGREQPPQVVRCLERWPVARVYTSDLQRAYDTAAAIATGRSLPLVVRAGLREINFGAWEGRSWEEIEASDPAAASAWLAQYPLLAAPGGQSLSDYRLQVESELTAILGESDRHCAAVVTHAGFIRTALAMTLGIPEKSIHRIEVEYGGVTALHHAGGSWTVRGVNLV